MADSNDSNIEKKANVTKSLCDIRVLVACMPKSGSTFLSAVLCEMPGMRRVNLVPGFKRREQEICLQKLANAEQTTKIILDLWRKKALRENAVRPTGWVTQMHVRYSETTANIINQNNIKPVVLVRNLFDVVVSIRDHFRSQAVFMSMAYVNDEMKSWPDDRLHHFIVDMVIPWYINFYLCWNDCPNKKFVTYEELNTNAKRTMREIVTYAGVPSREKYLDSALEKAAAGNTRKNKAVIGRGETLSDTVKDKIRHLASYYPHIDFKPLGL